MQKNDTIETLDLRDHPITINLIKSLSLHLSSYNNWNVSKIKSLILQNVDICELMCQYLAHLIKEVRKIEKIDLSNNNKSLICDRAFLPLYNLLEKGSSLKILILNRCSISQKEFILLINNLKLNKTLEEVHVKQNKIYIHGDGKILEMIKVNTKLRKFEFDNEEIERQQVEEILNKRNNNFSLV